jgi:hypothetical protein
VSLPTAEQIALEIKLTIDGLLTSRVEERFTDSDADMGADGDPGPVASMQGLRGIFGALAALPEDRELWALVKPYHASLFKEWQTVLDELAASNYGVEPYDAKLVFHELRQEHDSVPGPYVDTVAWAISSSVIINYVLPIATRNWGISVDAAFVDRTREEISRATRLLLDLQLPSGGWGWGRAVDLSVGHLYFSWTAIQGLADYFDYILGDSKDEIDVAVDRETLAVLETRDVKLQADAENARQKAAQFLREEYLTAALSNNGLTFRDLETKVDGIPRVTVKDPGSDLPIIYFYSYLLEALILSSYDQNNPAVVASRRSEMDRLYTEVKKRFAQVRAKAASDPLDADKSTAQITIHSAARRSRSTDPRHSHTFKDPGLWPQVLRTLVLYPYYVERPKFPDEDVIGSSSAYSLLLSDRRTKEQRPAPLLWDRYDFNLSITTRALEGLIDVYDYIRLVNKRIEDDMEDSAPPALADVLIEALYPHLRLRLQAENDIIGAVPPAAPPVSEAYVRNISLGAAEDGLSKTSAQAAHILMTRLLTMDAKAVKGFVDEVLGEKHDVFSRDNPTAYQLVRTIIVVCMATVSRLLPQILQEAVFVVGTSDEVSENERSYKGDAALYKRIRLALKEVMRHEIGTDGWEVDAAVRQLLLLMSATPAPPPPRGRSRANV